MPNSAAALFTESLDWLGVHGFDVELDQVEGVWRYVLDGRATTEGELIEKARALGMLKATGLQ